MFPGGGGGGKGVLVPIAVIGQRRADDMIDYNSRRAQVASAMPVSQTYYLPDGVPPPQGAIPSSEIDKAANRISEGNSSWWFLGALGVFFLFFLLILLLAAPWGGWYGPPPPPPGPWRSETSGGTKGIVPDTPEKCSIDEQFHKDLKVCRDIFVFVCSISLPLILSRFV